MVIASSREEREGIGPEGVARLKFDQEIPVSYRLLSSKHLRLFLQNDNLSIYMYLSKKYENY